MDLKKLNKILIIRLSSLGDILLTTPVIRAIKKANSEIQIDFLSKPAFKDVIRYNQKLKNKFILDTENASNELIENLQREKYDLIIDLQNNIRSREITRKLNVEISRFKKPNIKKFLLVNLKWNTYKNIQSVVEFYASTIPGLELDKEGLEFYSEKGKVSNIETNEKIIGICPGSRHFTKMWPREYFIELGSKLLKHKYKIKVLGGSADKEICKEIADQIPGAINQCSDDELFETADNMSECKFVVCNDSGLMHLASAIRVPLFAIFGSTVKEFGFYPYNCEHFVFDNSLVKCRPCSHIGRSSCPKKHFNCMLNIKPDLIIDKILQMDNNE